MTSVINHLFIKGAGDRLRREAERVQLVLGIDTVGGGWNAVMTLARALAMRGFDVTLAMLGPEPDQRQTAEITEAPNLRAMPAHAVAARLADSFGELQAAGQAVARLANVLAVDLVVLHHPALAAFGPFQAPVVVSPDGRDIIVASRARQAPGHEWRARLLRSGYQTATGVVAPSHADAGDIMDAHRLRRPPRVIRRTYAPWVADRPAVDLTSYAIAAHQTADGRENLTTLNEAAFLCPHPVMLAGASAGKVADSGHLWALGALTPGQIQRWLAGAQAFVSAAAGDSDGEMTWRAAEAGCAMVLADAPDYRELWDGAAAFTPEGDAVGLARTLTALMADSGRRKQLADAARTIARTWTVDKAAASWGELLTDIVATTPRSSVA